MPLCRVCGATGPAPSFDARETMHGHGGRFAYFQCPSCECLQIAEVPDDLPRYYEDGYYSFAEPPARHPMVEALIRTRDRYAVLNQGLMGRLMHAVMPRLDIRFLSRVQLNTSARVLDVGCGSGKLLRTLQRVGFQHLTGVDPFIEADIPLGPQARIHKTTLASFSEPQDLVMFNHSLEHMPDQAGTLRQAAALVGGKGVVTVSVPVVGSEAWSTYGTDWVQLDAPRHLFLHSERSLGLVARQAGLVVSEVFYDSNAFQFWGSEQCRRGIALTAPNSYLVNPAQSVFSKAEIAHFQREARRVNAARAGDQATFILRPA